MSPRSGCAANAAICFLFAKKAPFLMARLLRPEYERRDVYYVDGKISD